jgi:hypothetical protein
MNKIRPLRRWIHHWVPFIVRCWTIGYLLPLSVNAQGPALVNGTWEGNYGKTFLTEQPQKLVVELFLYNDSLLTGATHLYYKNNKYEHYKINGIYRQADSTVEFSEDSTISLRLGFFEDNCWGRYRMKLIKKDAVLRLEGMWRDKNRSIFNCPKSTVWLERPLPHTAKLPPAAIPSALQDTVVAVAANRAIDIQSLLEIKRSEMDSIRIDVYDNGEIDGDSVSVFYNDILLIQKVRITAKPLTFYINLSAQQPLGKLKLVAESLGSIPPCTAFMVVTTQLKRYELSLSSDFAKNGVLELFLRD